MSIRRITLTLGLLLLLCSFVGFRAAKADCAVIRGNGENMDCLNGSSCSSYGFFCTDEYCSEPLSCYINPPFQTIECTFGGCLNPFQGNCACTPD